MATSFAVDWIRATTKHHSISDVISRFKFGFEIEDWATSKGFNAYDSCIQNPYGHLVMWSTAYENQGVNIMFDGRSCNELHEAGYDLIEIVKWLSEEEFKFTRLDLAIDIRQVQIDIIELFNSEYTGSINNEPDLYMKGRNARGGATIYLGSRTSEKFIRIYDKAKQRKISDIFWTRVELELKAATATKIAKKMRSMTYEEIATMTQQIIRGMYNPENETFRGAFSVDPVKVGSTKNEDHDTYVWLMQSVAKTMAKTMLEMPHRDLMTEFMIQVETFKSELKNKQDLKKRSTVTQSS